MQESVKELKSCRMPYCKYNPNQEKAISHTTGPAMIIAGPGSGKTYVTVHRIQHLITHHGIDPAHILVITFTKAAAMEMQQRFFQMTKPLKPPVWFGTFHAVFYHILKHSAQYRGYTIIKESEKRNILHNIVCMHKRFAYIKEEDYSNLLQVISRRKSMPDTEQLICPFSDMKQEDFAFLIQEYQKYLTELQQMDFDDIMIYCESLLMHNADVLQQWQEQFQYIMVDEFQDISPVQYRIMRLLARKGHNIFIVGDDDQSIYRFRGASPANMQQFMRDYPEAEQITLNVNYRCHKEISNAGLAVVSENKDRFVKQIEAVHSNGEGIQCQIFDSEENEQQYLVHSLRKQQQNKTLDKSAIICRTNYECALWAQTLEQGKIPYHLKEVPASLFSHFVIKDLTAYLELAAGCRKRSMLLRIMNKPVRYIRRDSLVTEEITEQEWKRYFTDAPTIQSAIDRLFRELENIQGKKPYLAIRYIRDVVGYDSYLQSKYGATQCKELLRIADDFQKMAKQFASYAEIKEYIQKYEEMLKNQKTKAIESGDIEQNGVELLTMHASKGLEFDSVYLPGCMEGKIPSAKAVTELDVEEERRIFYVAMTRARKSLYISAVKGKTGKEIPSRFIKSICPR